METLEGEPGSWLPGSPPEHPSEVASKIETIDNLVVERVCGVGR